MPDILQERELTSNMSNLKLRKVLVGNFGLGITQHESDWLESYMELKMVQEECEMRQEPGEGANQ